MNMLQNFLIVLRIGITKITRSSSGCETRLYHLFIFNLIIMILQKKFGVSWKNAIRPLDFLIIISCGPYFSISRKNLISKWMIILLKTNQFGIKSTWQNQWTPFSSHSSPYGSLVWILSRTSLTATSKFASIVGYCYSRNHFWRIRLNIDKTPWLDNALAATRFLHLKLNHHPRKNCNCIGHVFSNCLTI